MLYSSYVTVPVPKGKSVTGWYYRDVALKSSRNIIRKDVQWQDFNMFVYCMIIWNCKAISEVGEGNRLVTPTVVSRIDTLPHTHTHHPPLLPFHTLSTFSFFLKQKFLSGRQYTWLSRQPVSQVYQSLPWRISEVDSQNKVMYFQPRRIFWRDVKLIWSVESVLFEMIHNKYYISNNPHNILIKG